MTHETNLERWQSTEVLRQYQEGRAATAGLAEEQIASALSPYLYPGTSLVEFGAGGGTLADIMHSRLPSDISWLETDQNPQYLDLPRASSREQAIIELPVVPLEDEVVNTVAGLSAFDTLSPSVLSESMDQFARILRPGGQVVHMLDLAPNTDSLSKQAAAKGLLAIPSVLHSEKGEMLGSGLSYVSSERLRTMLYTLNQPDHIKAVLSRLIHDYDETFYFIGSNYPEIFDYLTTALKSEGLIEDTTNLWEHFSAQIVAAAQQSGLTVIKAGVEEAEKQIDPGELPSGMPSDTALIERRFGVATRKNRNEMDAETGQTLVRSNLLLHVFQKPQTGR